nr:MAG TPA: Putative ATP dependent Clp protease [Caudoviricetes sp.]
MRDRLWELKQAASGGGLELYIYGDVESMTLDMENWRYVQSENSAQHFREELAKYPNAERIDIYVNSYGGDVFEGTAIYNQLKRHQARKVVHVDGFACSIASVIAMAGDEVIMPRNTLMMIHNMWMFACGNAAELRKAADDLDVINTAGRQAYLQKAGDKLPEDELVRMMDAETWLTAERCVELGLADRLADEDADMSGAAAILQKVNAGMEQRLQYQKTLAAQLRDMAAAPAPGATPNVDPQGGGSPEKNKVLSLFA